MSFFWRPYVSVAQKRAKALKQIEKMRKKGVVIIPIEIEGRTIAKSFWGKAWCDHLESFSDFENRLPRGRTYVRNGSVCHLEIKEGQINALVSGSELYNVSIGIKPLAKSVWKIIKQECSGKIGSMLELLKGHLSDNVMSIVTNQTKGLMPQPGEIKLNCSCPDWADMCKHVAAVLYGVGSRLDSVPELLFKLRGVDASELINADIQLNTTDKIPADKTIAPDRISDIFGIDMQEQSIEAAENTLPPTQKSARKIIIKTNTALKEKTAAKIVKTTPKISAALGSKKISITGKSVSILRKKLKLTVPQFAKQIGISSATVYRWEKTAGRLNMQHSLNKILTELYMTVQE